MNCFELLDSEPALYSQVFSAALKAILCKCTYLGLYFKIISYIL